MKAILSVSWIYEVVCEKGFFPQVIPMTAYKQLRTMKNPSLNIHVFSGKINYKINEELLFLLKKVSIQA